ncbi:MAG: class I SAM-dependent methyltransferase [Burkholderiales bacterium]
MNEQIRKRNIRELFDLVSAGYDKPALRFFAHAADRLADRMNLTGDEHLLDVACGTGTVSFACAKRLPEGRVTGVDLSEGMLARARIKAEEQALHNILFKYADMESMKVDGDAYDGACCGFGVFFLPDMEAAFCTIAELVRPGGAIGISSFTGEVMEPLSSAFIACIRRYGIEVPPLSWKRLDDAAKHRALYAAAGIDAVDTGTEQLGYYLAGFDEWWDILNFSGYRGLLNQLSADDLARFKQDHRSEIEALATGSGLWLNVPVLVSVGRKPGLPVFQ